MKHLSRLSIENITDFIGCLVVLIVLVQCNTVYSFVLNTPYNMSLILKALCICLLVGYILLRHATLLMQKRISIGQHWQVLIMPFGIAFYAMAYYRLTRTHSSEYLLVLVILLALFTTAFAIDRLAGRPYCLLDHISNITTVFCVVNLTMYVCVLLNADFLTYDIVDSYWAHTSNSYELRNYLNVCINTEATQHLFGLELLRNYGSHTEPLMFCIPLITSLYYALFVSEENRTVRIFKDVLFTVAIISSTATIAIMIMLMAWGIWIMRRLYRRIGGRGVAVVFLALLVVFVYLVVQKWQTAYNSLSVHIEDYIYGWKAFLVNPIWGAGFGNSTVIQSFMSAERYATNRGLSNDLTVIFGQGGILLGALCTVPYLIIVGQFARRDNRERRIAFWGMGVGALYVLTIFTYTVYLAMIMGFGYAILAAALDERLAGLILPSTDDGVVSQDAIPGVVDSDGGTLHNRLSARTIRITFLVLAIVIVIAIFHAPIYDNVYRFLKGNQLMIGQSPIRSLGLLVVVTLHLWMIGKLLLGRVSSAGILALAISDVIYVMQYAYIASLTATVLEMYDMTEPLVGGVLFAYYLLICVVVSAIVALIYRWRQCKFKYKWIGITAVVCIGGLVTGVILYAESHLPNCAFRIEEGLQAADIVTGGLQGQVFSNELPALYHAMNSDILLSGAADNGYCIEKNISLVCNKEDNLHEMFEHGYQIAEITEHYVVYTNDASAVEQLAADGYTFYDYYPFEMTLGTGVVEGRNNYDYDQNGYIQLDEAHSAVAYRKYEELYVGRYRAMFALHINEADYVGLDADTPICILSVEHNSGLDTIKSVTVTLGEFSEGELDYPVSFMLKDDHNDMRFHIETIDGCDMTVEGVTLVELP